MFSLRLILMSLEVEFIIMGGTFMSMPEDYRNKFIAQLHNALSGFTGFDVDEAVRSVAVRPLPQVEWDSECCAGIRSKVNQRQSESRSKLGRTIVYGLT